MIAVSKSSDVVMLCGNRQLTCCNPKDLLHAESIADTDQNHNCRKLYTGLY